MAGISNIFNPHPKMKKIVSPIVAFFLFIAILPVANADGPFNVYQNDVFSFQYEGDSLVNVNRQLDPGPLAAKFKSNNINFLLFNIPNRNNYIFFNDLTNFSDGLMWTIVLSGDLKFPEDLQKIASTVHFNEEYLQDIEGEKEAARLEILNRQKEEKKNAQKSYGARLNAYGKSLLYGTKKVFDDCPGLAAYSGRDFYGQLVEKLNAANIFTTAEQSWAPGVSDGGFVNDACYSESAQKILMLIHYGGGGEGDPHFSVAEYDILNGGLLVTKWWQKKGGYYIWPYPEKFGLRKKNLVQMPADPTCYYPSTGPFDKLQKKCMYAMYTYNLVTKKLKKNYLRYRVPTPVEIQEAKNRK